MQLPSPDTPAPGIQAMQMGQPWTVPGNHYHSPPTTRAIHLEPIRNLFQSAEAMKTLPTSPKSTASEPPPYMHTDQPVNCLQATCVNSSTQELSINMDPLSSLAVPDVAQASSGGCFDPENWIFRMVWSHVHNMDIPQLMSSFFYREDRGKYGEHHTSTRGAAAAAFQEASDDVEYKAKGSDNHRHQEQGRRVRHRYLQAESDECISTHDLEMAQKELPNVKKIIQEMHEQNKALAGSAQAIEGYQHEKAPRGTSATGKKLGKDDQLLAALMSQYVSFVLIFRLHKKVVDVQQDNEALTRELALLRADDVKQEKEVTSEDNQGKPFVLPLPVTATKGKRHFEGERSSQNQDTSCLPQTKRRHLAPVSPALTFQTNGRHQLPPSPTPSCDGSIFSSFRSY